MTFELWASDLFDRESPPSRQKTFSTLREGLEALWRASLDEGIQDDGRPTFTWFTLTGPSSHLKHAAPSLLRVELPRDPFVNLELAMLRQRWKLLPGLAGRLAELHEAVLPAPVSLEQLLVQTTELPGAVLRAADVLARHLGFPGTLATTPAGWALGEVRLSASWTLPEPEYRLWLDGFTARFTKDEVVLEVNDDRSKVLGDVLAEAGLAVRWAQPL